MGSFMIGLDPSGSAGCTGQCKEKIPRGSIRVGSVTDGAGDSDVKPYCPARVQASCQLWVREWPREWARDGHELGALSAYYYDPIISFCVIQ